MVDQTIGAVVRAQRSGTSETASGGIPLRIAGVSKQYPGRDGVVTALEPIDLDIAAGEFVCLLGPSGCGKSTLLSMIAGLDAPSSGTIESGGQAITGPGTDRVLLFQEAALFPWLDVQRNVEFGLKQAGVAAKQRAALATQLLATVNLQGFERSFAHQLSGGMRQRVAIARALAINPAVLLMDEPFGALDALTRDRLHGELEAIWTATRKTIVFVTHNVREAVALGDRVLVFSPRPGRVIADVRIELPRSRSLDDVALVRQAAQLTGILRETMEEHHGA